MISVSASNVAVPIRVLGFSSHLMVPLRHWVEEARQEKSRLRFLLDGEDWVQKSLLHVQDHRMTVEALGAELNDGLPWWMQAATGDEVLLTFRLTAKALDVSDLTPEVRAHLMENFIDLRPDYQGLFVSTYSSTWVDD